MDRNRAIDLIGKIQRLLEPGSGATEGEMQAAASAVQRLLKNHNLSMIDVEDSKTKEKAGKKGHDIGQREGMVRKRSSLPKFEKILINIVAKACECQCYLQQEWSGKGHGKVWRIFFIGDQFDIIVAGELYTYLNKAINKMASKSYPKQYSKQNSFWYGCIDRLGKRFEKEAEKFEEEHGEYAMVLFDKKGVIEKWVDDNLKLVSGKSKKGGTNDFDPLAYAHGHHYGSKLDISSGKHLEN